MLAAATWRGGELLDEPGAGVLVEGGPADFFLVHGDPLSDPSALWRDVGDARCRDEVDTMGGPERGPRAAT
jgi:imidazolonepropionase-like amidohydrolase